MSPGAARAMVKMNAEIDVRAALPAIHVPTLVIHRTGDLACPVAGGRYIAEHIEGARFVELPGDDHLPWMGDADPIVGEIEQFVGRIAHRGDDDRDVMPGLAGVDDPPRDALDAGRVRDAGTAVLLNDQ